MAVSVEKADFSARTAQLRAELTLRNLDGFLVPRADEHLGEYIGDHAKRLGWLTGFDGSAGLALVRAHDAILFVDDRYSLQARAEIAPGWRVASLALETVATELRKGSHGEIIGYDPWLHSQPWLAALAAMLASSQIQLAPVQENPVDTVWLDRPLPSKAELLVHPIHLTGESSATKRSGIAQWLGAIDADAVVIASLDSIAWIFNIRGRDIGRIPVVLAFALVWADSRAELFVEADKLNKEVLAHLGGEVQLHDYAEFEAVLAGLVGRRIAVDPLRTVAAIRTGLEAGGAEVIEADDPALLPKAIKTPAEIAGHRAAQSYDCAALCRFLHWLSEEADAIDEIEAARKLELFRRASGHLFDLSFDTVSAFGPSGAIPHYRVTERSNRIFDTDSLYLVDSGGQYPEGTTDITRTVAIGRPSGEMRDRFTRVLKAHIALAEVVFPAGTHGTQLDAIARQHLWRAGLDYPHGTGHGVGSFLGVHEGPHRISTTRGEEPLRPGMILSNEPAYYKADAFGIRTENLMLVVETKLPGAEHPLLGFEMLSFVPIDRSLINIDLLWPSELAWIDSYHAKTAEMIGPQLEEAALQWLLAATRSIGAGR